jgi:uncharacterized repeat protein (TIGR01451 family)
VSQLIHQRRASVLLVAALIVVLAAALAGSAANAQAVGADLQVTLGVSPASGVGPGSNVTYTAAVTNNGPSAAAGVNLTVTLPQGVIPVSASPSACAFAASGASVTCAFGAMAAGVSQAATIVVHPVTTGAKTATARVTSGTSDPSTGNNTASVSSTITSVGISDLRVTLEDGPDPIRAGDTLVYRATVFNIQDDTARDVVLTDALPAGVALVSVSASQGTCAVAGSTVTCQLGNINPGAGVVVKTAVQPTAAGLLYNTAGVGMSTVDPSTANNSATARTWVNP